MNSIIKRTEQFVKEQFQSEATGHDWFHMLRVRNLACQIYQYEQTGDWFIIEMAALLHDFYDDKLTTHPDHEKQKLEKFLYSLSINENDIDQIFQIIDTISFRGGQEAVLTSIEAKIVRDADRIDAIGAIGIARTFAYGGKKGQPIYDPTIEIRDEMSFDEYRNGKTSTIHHFYEKLLKLKDLMQTEGGKAIAAERHQFIERFLKQFFQEWNGETCEI